MATTATASNVFKMLTTIIMVFLLRSSFGLAPHSQQRARHRSSSQIVLHMGLFDGIAKAFSNEDFKPQDNRVRASHILIKGDDFDEVLGKVKSLFGEINKRMDSAENSSLVEVFSELARRDSQCPSSAQGGDLGLFGPGQMVAEFDQALFPEDSSASPPVGALVGPVITEFGSHIILVTKREKNRDQVEEKLARIDPDAAR